MIMREPNKKRFFNAVNHIESEEVAFLELDPDMSLAKQILDKDLPMDLHVYELDIGDYVELNKRMGNDMHWFSHIWRLGRKEKKDKDGRIHYIDGLMKKRSDMKDIWYPDLDLLERRLEETLTLLEGTKLGVTCSVQSPAFIVATAMGYEDYWVNAALDPDFVLEFQDIIQEWCMKELELYLRYPIDVIKLGSGFVTKTGPMCSPAMLEKFETSYLRRQAQTAKENDKLVYFHIDGNIADMIPDMIKMGVDIVNPIEPCSGLQDIYKIKEKYGDKITLSGNIDIDGVLLNGSVDDVKHDVIEHMEKLAVGGGYIVSSSHDLHQLIPVENFYAMRDAVHDYRFSESGS